MQIMKNIFSSKGHASSFKIFFFFPDRYKIKLFGLIIKFMRKENRNLRNKSGTISWDDKIYITICLSADCLRPPSLTLPPKRGKGTGELRDCQLSLIDFRCNVPCSIYVDISIFRDIVLLSLPPFPRLGEGAGGRGRGEIA
jgi:hypothetical protein